FCEFPVAAMIRALPFSRTALVISSAACLAAATADSATEPKTRTLAVPARKSRSDFEARPGRSVVFSELVIVNRHAMAKRQQPSPLPTMRLFLPALAKFVSPDLVNLQ